MAELTSAERVLRTLRREEPDRIPHFEWIFDHRVREAILPGCTMEEFTLRMGLDAVLTGPNFTKVQVGEKKWRNEWGVVQEDSGEEHLVPIAALEPRHQLVDGPGLIPGRLERARESEAGLHDARGSSRWCPGASP